MYSVTEDRLITRPELLRESHVPEQLLHRMDQLQVVAESVEPVVHGKTPKTVLLHGPSGAGKTSLSRHLLERMEAEYSAVRTAYVNCWDAYSRFDLLKALVQALGMRIVRGKVSAKELQFRIEKAADAVPCVLALDEVDQLEGKKLLYSLGALPVALVLISHEDTVLYQLDERIRSRLGPIERVRFSPYQLQELADIVESRARYGLKPDVISQPQIRRIAATAGGNAHLAIESLRLAAERADRHDRDALSDEDVQQAVAEARRTVRTKSLSRLNQHQKLLYEVIKAAGEIPAGALHKRYREQATEPLTERAVRNYLHKLEKYGFIRKKGTGRWRSYAIMSK